MSEDELKAIEAKVERRETLWPDEARPLVAEVRRLKALVKDANCDGWCVWCSNTVRAKPLERDPDVHDADCPAFTPDGDVR